MTGDRKGRCHSLRWRLFVLAAFCITLLPITETRAADLRRLEVSNKGDSYRIQLEMELDIGADYVREVLTDYRHIYRLNPSIVDSRILPSPGNGVARVFTRMEGCVLFYCTEFTRVEDVQENSYGELDVVIVPGMSNFGSGTAAWRITGHGQRSSLAYEAELQPEIFIPPIIGSLIVKNKLREEILTTFNRIECHAKVRLSLDESGADRTIAVMDNHGTC